MITITYRKSLIAPSVMVVGALLIAADHGTTIIGHHLGRLGTGNHQVRNHHPPTGRLRLGPVPRSRRRPPGHVDRSATRPVPPGQRD